MAEVGIENDEAVVYTKEQDDDHSDIWDDTALIAAYDKAVGLMKADVAMRSQTPRKVNEGGNKSKKHKKKIKSKTMKWRVGDKCEAIYNEDGMWYTAIIKNINPNNGTCTVEYIGYGNMDEVSLNDVRSPHKTKHRRRENQLSTQNSETSEIELHNISTTVDSDEGSIVAPPSKQCSGGFNPTPPSCCHNFRQWPPFNAPWQFPTMHPPSPWEGNFPHSCSCAHSSCSSHKMNLPPPPAPMMPPLLFESVDDALASTLMAWYMSGYHTGYYQAMKQSNKRQSTHRSQGHQ